MKEPNIYWPGNSILHRLDPRLKVGGMLWLSFALTLTGWKGLLLASAGLVILIVLSQLPLRIFRSAVIMLFWLAVFYIIAGGWVWPNTIFFWQGHWSLAGINDALHLIWRIAVLFGMTRLFTAVTPDLELGLGIAFFLNPLIRLTPKAADFALLITLTLRFIPLLLEEAALLAKARAAKGALPTSWLKKLLELINLLPPLLLISLRRAEEVAENLLARGYASGKYRTLSTQTWGGRDSRAAVAAGMAGVILIVLSIK